MRGRKGRRMAGEHGFALVELMVSSALLLVVLSATLAALGSFDQAAELSADQNDAQDRTRVTVDRLSRDLRNLAEPTPDQSDAATTQPSFELAGPYDVVMRTVDPDGVSGGQNLYRIRRVRYCLDGNTAGNGKIWVQTQTWSSQAAPAAPSTDACPGTGWATSEQAADRVSNRTNGRADRPMFTFGPSTWSNPGQIKSIRADLYVDLNGRSERGESHLTSGVFLRNQNLPPVQGGDEAFTASLAGSRHILLNALAFEDPEGGPLSYVWYDGATKVGTGMTLDYQAPTAGTHTITLKVVDDRGLTTTAPSQEVNVT